MMNARDIAEREGNENRRKVYDWVLKNPCRNQSECAKALQLHRKTVGRHWDAIRSGWTPETAHKFGRSPNRFFSGVTSQEQATAVSRIPAPSDRSGDY